MKKNKNILIILGIVVVLIIAYFVVVSNRGTSAPTGLVSTTGATGATTGAVANSSAIGQEFITMLFNVKNIKLDLTIFSPNQALASLKDYSVVLPQVASEGRTNPFLPIGSDQQAQAVSSQTQTGTGTQPASEETTEGGVNQ